LQGGARAAAAAERGSAIGLDVVGRGLQVEGTAAAVAAAEELALGLLLAKCSAVVGGEVVRGNECGVNRLQVSPTAAAAAAGGASVALPHGMPGSGMGEGASYAEGDDEEADRVSSVQVTSEGPQLGREIHKYEACRGHMHVFKGFGVVTGFDQSTCMAL
jgi:hypothetical protein